MNKKYFGVVMLLWTLPVFSWTVIATNDSNLTFEVDEKSINKRGPIVKFYEKLTYVRPEQIDAASGKTIHEKKIYRIVNCTNNTQGVLKGTLYGENRSLIESVTFTESKVDMQLVPAGTVAEVELALVCKAAGVPVNYSSTPNTRSFPVPVR